MNPYRCCRSGGGEKEGSEGFNCGEETSKVFMEMVSLPIKELWFPGETNISSLINKILSAISHLHSFFFFFSFRTKFRKK